MNTTHIIISAAFATVLLLAGCKRQPAAKDDHNHSEAAAAPTNRIDIPPAVRRNLSMTFARVESRNVERTLRVPGKFELLPDARREYRAPIAGRVELLVSQYQSVDKGTPLYRLESSDWLQLHTQLDSARTLVASMTPLRESHRVHERSLAEKVKVWEERLKQLEALRTAGGGSASQWTDAQATLIATQAELADVMEKDAELMAAQSRAESELRALEARRDMLLSGARCTDTTTAPSPLVVCAVAPGIIDTLDITQGSLATENAPIITIVQPDQLRFRARVMQSDLGQLRDGLPVRIVSAHGGSQAQPEPIGGTLHLSPQARAEDRTLDLIVTPTQPATQPNSWARAGIAAQLEITLEGGTPTLAIPLAAVVRDGVTPIIFRRDPKNPDQAIRLEADLGPSDGRWVVIQSGVKEGDEIVLGGNYQLMLATGVSAPKGGHFHPDGTFHDEEH